MERVRGFEPPTNGLGSRCATTALHPPARQMKGRILFSVAKISQANADLSVSLAQTLSP